MWHRVWIWERKLHTGKTYCLRWYEEVGHIRTETVGPDRKLAERLRSQREVDLNTGKLQSVREVSYGEFVKEELLVMRGRLAEASLTDLEHTLRSFGEFSKVDKLAEITPAMVESYHSARLKEVRPATANKNLRTLKASLSRAVARGMLQANPASRVKQVREPEQTLRVLRPEEVGKLLEACRTDRWKALIALAVTTGMRRGEMLALRWEDIDLASGTILVRNSEGHLTKSRRNRVLALSPEISKLLGRLPRRGELVFHTQQGKPWRNNLTGQFRRIVKRAGIKHCTLHDLRRSFVSHLAMAGVSATVVRELAGHASITTTQRYYTEILPEALRNAQAKLPFGEVVAAAISDSYHGQQATQKAKAARVITLSRAAG